MRMGTKAKIQKQDAAAMREFIRSLHGSLKCKPGGKTFAEEMAEYKCEEKELEEAKYARSTGAR